jgi:hypothetical protein
VPLRKRRRLGTWRIPLHPTRVATHHATPVLEGFRKRCLATPPQAYSSVPDEGRGVARVHQLFAIFNEPITMTGVPKPQARGLASLNIIVERSRKRTVNS